MAACASNISRGCITVSCKSMPTPRRGSAMSTSVSIPEAKTFHMTPDEFRKQGYAVVDWIADYYARLETFPVLSRVEPGAIRRSLPKTAPVAGEAFETILAEVEKLILPGITHWQSPNFFAFFQRLRPSDSLRLTLIRPWGTGGGGGPQHSLFPQRRGGVGAKKSRGRGGVGGKRGENLGVRA